MKQYSFVFLVLFIILISSSSSLVRSQDSCNSKILNVSGIPFDTSSLRCAAVWPKRNFILGYAQASSNLWSFVLSYSKDINSYGAIGFSKDGRMVGSSAVVGWLGLTGVGAGLKQYYLGGHRPDQVIPGKGDLPWTKAAIVSASRSNIAYMAFQLETNKPLPYLIFAIGPNGSFPSPPNYSLAFHSHDRSFKMDYAFGGKVSGPAPAPAPFNY